MQALPKDHFAWFGLTPSFELDLAQLQKAYRQVQAAVHPDKFAGASDQQRRIALQMASAANEAFTILRDPLRRAIYLCELHGLKVGSENNTVMDPEFLMQQMQWREIAEEAKQLGRDDMLVGLRNEVQAEEQAIAAECSRAFSVNAVQPGAAAGLVRRWMFLRKFLADLAPTY